MLTIIEGLADDVLVETHHWKVTAHLKRMGREFKQISYQDVSGSPTWCTNGSSVTGFASCESTPSALAEDEGGTEGGGEGGDEGGDGGDGGDGGRSLSIPPKTSTFV